MRVLPNSPVARKACPKSERFSALPISLRHLGAKHDRSMKHHFVNTSTRIYVAILGTLGGLGGVLHGISEIVQGSKPPADILPRIGAFTVIPNYLITGFCAVIVGTSVVVWPSQESCGLRRFCLLVQLWWSPRVALADEKPACVFHSRLPE